MTTLSSEAFGRLIDRAAQALNAEDYKRIDANGDHYQSVCGPSSDGETIVSEIFTDAGHPNWALPAYLLLAYTWNDILDWADEDGPSRNAPSDNSR